MITYSAVIPGTFKQTLICEINCALILEILQMSWNRGEIWFAAAAAKGWGYELDRETPVCWTVLYNYALFIIRWWGEQCMMGGIQRGQVGVTGHFNSTAIRAEEDYAVLHILISYKPTLAITHEHNINCSGPKVPNINLLWPDCGLWGEPDDSLLIDMPSCGRRTADTPPSVSLFFFFLVLSGTAISFKMKRNALKQKRKLDCHLDLESFQSLITVTWA